MADPFIELCIEMLSPLGPVRPRRMFGGHGIYVDGLFMALVIANQLYLKIDDVSRERFVAAGCEPFSYSTKNGERQVMSYYRPPEETLESPALMLPWARLALEAALRAANAKAAKPVARKKSATRAKPAAKPAAADSAASAKPAAKLAASDSAASAKRAAKPAVPDSAAKKPAAKKTAAGS